MKKTLMTLILCALTPAALAADTYGYLAMWQNPADSNEALQIKTTKENATSWMRRPNSKHSAKAKMP